MKPLIEFIPLKNALPEGLPSELDVLVRIHAPQVKAAAHQRMPLNLSLVLDRSGSMSGQPMEFARQAARVAVQQMKDGDRVSVVAFDDQVEVVAESTVLDAQGRERVLQAIQTIEARGSTDLHAGWAHGGLQVSHFLNMDHLNRVIVLSDGMANVGITDDRQIHKNVSGLSERGVSTTTLGMGDHFNEDLMQGMAEHGDGNYHFVSEVRDLPGFFEQELQGLKQQFATRVSLGIEPNRHHHIKVKEVFNPFQRLSTGRLKLPSLQFGKSIDLVLRLSIPALTSRDLDGPEAGLFRVRLAYSTGAERTVVRAQCNLPLLSPTEFARLPEHPLTLEKRTLLEVARDKDEAMVHLDRGDRQASQDALERARAKLGVVASSPAYFSESSELQTITEHMAQGNVQRARKESKYQNYKKRNSRE